MSPYTHRFLLLPRDLIPSDVSWLFLNSAYSSGRQYHHLYSGIHFLQTWRSKCAAGLIGLLNKANSSHLFIAANQYHDHRTGGLVVPSSDLMEVAILIEAEFCNNIEKIFHMSKVSFILITLILSKMQGKLECDSCKTLEFVVHLYINIRLHHILCVNIRVFYSCKGTKIWKFVKLKLC